MKISVCVPTYKHPELTDSFLQQFFANTDFTQYEIELVVCDDASGMPEVTAVLEKWRLKYPDIMKVVVRETNGGFPGATNSAINASAGEYIVCLSNDVNVLRPEWLPALLKPHLEGKKCITGGHYIDFNSITNIDNVIVDYVGGWCMCFSREFVTELKKLQNHGDQIFLEEFKPGYFEDVTLSFMAKHVMGYELIAPPLPDLPDVHLTHIGSQTINAASVVIPAVTQRNQITFRDFVRLQCSIHGIELK